VCSLLFTALAAEENKTNEKNKKNERDADREERTTKSTEAGWNRPDLAGDMATCKP